MHIRKKHGYGIMENTNVTIKKEISLDDIRAKYGTETVRAKARQNTIAG